MWSDSSADWNQSKGPLFWEAIRPLLVSGGWSLWHRNVLVKLVSRGIWTQERLARLRCEDDGSCQLCNDGPGTMFHRCYECPALQTESRHVRLTGGARGCTFAGEFSISGNSLHTAFFLTLAPFFQQVFLERVHARFSGTNGPQMGYWRSTFSQTALRRATVRCDGLAGQLLRSTMQETSRRLRMGRYRATFCLNSPPEMAKTTQRPWRGSSLWIRSRSTSTAKVPSRQSMGQSTKPWEPEAPEHTSGTGFCFPTTRSGQSRSRVMRQRATWRLGELPTCAKGATTLQTPSQKKVQIHTSPLFESPRQLLLVRPWPSKRHVGRPKRTLSSGSGGGTTPGLPRHDHGYGPRERDSSESGRRRLLRRLQVRFPTGFLPFFPHVSRKTVTSTLAHSDGTACNWDEFSMLEAELWTTLSSFAPSVERSTGSVRMRFAANAANS